jgi:hypothetical protein
MKDILGFEIFGSQDYKELRQRIVDKIDDDEEGLTMDYWHRKFMLDSAFVFDEEHARLMKEASDSMSKAIIELYKMCWTVYTAACEANKGTRVTVEGIAMPTYSNNHPFDIEEEEIVVDTLCERCYNPAIDLKHAVYLTADYGHQEKFDEQRILAMEPLYCSKEDWLKGLQVPRLFNYWLEQTNYALYDLLWIREYTFEIDIDIDDIRL